MRNKILLFSSGLDSMIAWYYLGKPDAIYFDLGHRYAEKEKESAIDFAIQENMKLEISDELKLGNYELDTAEIPLRNLFLIAHASLRAKKVFLVCQKGERELPDRSEIFFKKTQEFLSFLLDRNVELDPVFPNMTKTQMVGWYLKNNLPKDSLIKAFSCYSEIAPCYNCSACFRKVIALVNNGIILEKFYKIKNYTGLPGYLLRLKEHHYIKEREKETFNALQKLGIVS